MTVALAAGLLVGAGAPAWAAPPTAAPTLTQKPPSLTNSTSATFAWTNSKPGSTNTCSLDGAPAKSCTSPITYTGLKGGTHSFSVRALISGQKTSKPATWSWTVDLTAPLAPTVSQPASPTKLNPVSVTFSSAATDLNHFTCSIDGAAQTTCASPFSATVPAPVADGLHSLAVRAVDNVGNVGPAKTVSWLLDTSTSKPVVNTGPADPTTATSATFTYSSSELGVAFTCSLDGAAFVACPGGSPMYSGLSVGGAAHTFRVKATDPAGNTATSNTYSWKVAAAVSVVLGWNPGTPLPASVTNKTTGNFAFTTSVPTTNVCKLDGVVQGSCTGSDSVSGLTDGPHTYAVAATGGFPSQTVTLSYGWTVDTVAPVAPAIDGPTGTLATNAADVVVTAGESGNTVTCTLDSVTADCSAPLSLTGLADGDHTVVAVAHDAAGNTASASLTWTVDTTAPLAPTVSQPASPTNANPLLPALTITKANSDTDVDYFICSVDGASPVTCDSPFSPTVPDPVVDGLHSLDVRAVDKVGNVGAAASVSWLLDTTISKPVVNTGPADPTTATSATFTYSSSDVGVTFTCSLDGAAFTSCPGGTVTYSGLAVSGTPHTFVVNATDAVGNVGTSDPFSWTVAPTVSVVLGWNPGTPLPASVTNKTTGNFAFTTSVPTTNVCKLDGVVRASCTGSDSVSGLTDGPHTYSVAATGGAPSQTVTITYSWTVDTVPPTAPAIDGPSGTVSTGDADIVVTAGDAGDTVTCTVDGAGADCSAPLSLTGLSEGDHTVVAVETDTAGNTKSASLTWTVDTTAPSAPTVSQPASSTKLNPVSVTLSSAATDLDHFTCSIDGAAPSTCTSPFSATVPAPAADGLHSLVVRAVDHAGNVSTATSVSWLLDTSTSKPVVDTGPADPTTATSADFTYSSSELGVTFTCSLD
ncbi:MAG: Ig-like domain-containing protein, partial [Actinomycetes bacterium]